MGINEFTLRVVIKFRSLLSNSWGLTDRNDVIGSLQSKIIRHTWLIVNFLYLVGLRDFSFLNNFLLFTSFLFWADSFLFRLLLLRFASRFYIRTYFSLLYFQIKFGLLIKYWISRGRFGLKIRDFSMRYYSLYFIKIFKNCGVKFCFWKVIEV